MSVLCEPCEEREPETYKSTQCAKSLNIDVDNFQTYVRCTSCDCFGVLALGVVLGNPSIQILVY